MGVSQIKGKGIYMKARFIYLTIAGALVMSACSVQTRNVADELYQTPTESSEKNYIAQQPRDTVQDKDQTRPRLQHAPYWMYEHYPYHPYYGSTPFDFYVYHPFSFFPYPSYYYGWAIHRPYHYSSWYGPYYPYYWYTPKKIQRKPHQRSFYGSVGENRPISPRIRKTAPTNVKEMIDMQRVRKGGYNPQAQPPKRYRRAIEPLRKPLHINTPQRKITTPQRIRNKSNLMPFNRSIKQISPVRNHQPNHIRIKTPTRSTSPAGRKRK